MRGVSAWICSAARRTEACEVRSTRTVLTGMEASMARMSETTSSILDCVRETRMRREGLCRAKASAAPPPMPPREMPVMRTAGGSVSVRRRRRRGKG